MSPSRRFAPFAAVCVGLSLTVVTPTFAEDAPSGTWSGEGTLTAGFTTGNTETSDLGIGLKLARTEAGWRQALDFNAEYGETDGLETRNRVAAGLQIERELNPRTFLFGRGAHEVDAFSGFDSRTFRGGGIGYRVLDAEGTKWRLEAAPGWRRDELASGATETSAALRLASAWTHTVNTAVGLSLDTTVNVADVSTQFSNVASLTAQLSERLAARASFELRTESDPLPGLEQTDTATRLSLVYGF
jgi:putative salt-induced outer membrane protein